MLKLEIREGDRIPNGYGIAYLNWTERFFVCYPFPINHAVRLLRDLWVKIRNAKFREYELEKFREIGREIDKVARAERQLEIAQKEFDNYKMMFMKAMGDVLIGKLEK